MPARHSRCSARRAARALALSACLGGALVILVILVDSSSIEASAAASLVKRGSMRAVARRATAGARARQQRGHGAAHARRRLRRHARSGRWKSSARLLVFFVFAHFLVVVACARRLSRPMPQVKPASARRSPRDRAQSTRIAAVMPPSKPNTSRARATSYRR